MIKVINVTKIFDCIKVLDNINLEVRDELIAILGSTGEGKTVLLKIIAGLIKPDLGRVLLDKEDTMGFVFQHSSLFDSLAAEANIRLPLEECSCLKEKEIDEKVNAVISLLALDENLLKRRPTELSGGERKIVAVGRAIINNPTYMLYDEPTTGLDPITHDRICSIIKNLNKPGIVVTHNIDTIKRVGINTIYLLKIGRLKLMSDTDTFYWNPIRMPSITGEGFKKEHYE